MNITILYSRLVRFAPSVLCSMKYSATPGLLWPLVHLKALTYAMSSRILH
jgi:hypothetical protein